MQQIFEKKPHKTKRKATGYQLINGRLYRSGCLRHWLAGRFFSYTAGRVSRFYRRTGKDRRPSTWMAITADYAYGSSGGPVFNDRGQVVGMVSSTSSLYYQGKKAVEEKKGPLQMVMKNCVSLAEMRRLLVGKAVDSVE